MKLNGENVNLKEGLSVFEMLEAKGFDVEKVLVELNRKILAKNLYNETRLNFDDEIEVVTFVGGG